MLNTVRYILIYSAGIILFLHTVVSHEHHVSFDVSLQDVDSCNENHTFLDLIKDFLEIDLGDGHMDNFNADHCDMEIDGQLQFSPTTLPAILEAQADFLVDQYCAVSIYQLDESPPPNPFLSSSLKRGPPFKFL